MTVFVGHEVRDDISPALKFGELRYINRFYIHGDELERSQLGDDNVIPTGYRLNIERAVADFRPETDYLLIAGDHLQLLAMTALLAGYFDWFRVLRYDRQLNDYIPVRLSSGIVPPRGAVVTSGMASQREPANIGENEHGESRSQHQHQHPPDARNLETLSVDDRKIRRPR